MPKGLLEIYLKGFKKQHRQSSRKCYTNLIICSYQTKKITLKHSELFFDSPCGNLDICKVSWMFLNIQYKKCLFKFKRDSHMSQLK